MRETDIYIYIYIYRERERERQMRQTDRDRQTDRGKERGEFLPNETSNATEVVIIRTPNEYALINFKI